MNAILPLPSFYDPANAGKWDFEPNAASLLELALDWASTYKIKPATGDRLVFVHTHIDEQNDFSIPPLVDQHGRQIGGGSLFVGGRSGRGAVDDSARIAEFMYRNMGLITAHQFTIDTHNPYQLFCRAFWRTADGKVPGPFTTIVAEEGHKDKPHTAHAIVLNKDIRPVPAMAQFFNGNYAALMAYLDHYCRTLYLGGKYALILWTEHCQLGNRGHNLVGVIQEARLFHSYARGMNNYLITKGTHPLSERYSPITEEVTTLQDGRPLPNAQRSTEFITTLMQCRYMAVSGQAGSHCFKAFLDELVKDIMAKDPALARKIYIMTDCTSAVVIPGVVDFTDMMLDGFKRFEAQGLNLVRSTDPIETWPGLVL